MKRVLAAVVAAAAALVTAGIGSGARTAAAPQPLRAGTVVANISAANACPAASKGMTITYLGGTITVTKFPNGGSFSGGVGHMKVTNIATGKSVVVRSSGYGYYGPQGDGFVNASGGPDQLWTFNRGDVGPGSHSVGRVYLIAGVTSAQITASGATVAFNYVGKIVKDICAAIR